MGPLTESMTRLCGEIVALRGARLAFVRDLGQDVASLQAEFRHTHAEMARRTKAERQGFVKSLGHEVASLRASFRRAHADMARKTRAERRAVWDHMKKTLSADLAGAHRAWFGPSPAELRAKAEAERRAKAETEIRAKEEAERQRREAEALAKEEAARQQAAHKEEPGRPGPGKKKG